jgi:hypothetical protein
MTEDRKSPIWPLTAALAIAFPLLYVASFGPAVWLESDGWISIETLCTAYRPVCQYFAYCPAALRRPLVWCWQLGGANDITLFFLVSGPQNPRPRPIDKSGLAIKLQDGAVMVARVYSDSPAAEAGVESGDEIRSIDGRPTEDLTPTETRELLAEDGRTVFVELQRGAHHKHVSICLRNYDKARPRQSGAPL